MTTITLSGNYGYTSYSASHLADYTTIDASNASWIAANCRNQNPDADTPWSEGTGQLNTYPFKISDGGTGLILRGGHIWGEVPQTSDWLYTYNNSAGLRIETSPNVTIDEWRIDKVWDAVRIAPGTTNWLINDTYISNVRDDAVEDDYLLSGTVRDSLFDGVHMGISLANSSGLDGSASTITLEGAFIRHEDYLVKGQWTHGSPFKTNEADPGATPNIRIINSVIAIEDPNHYSQGRLAVAWEHVVESHGNVFLNLSDTPLPATYPLPPSGFTILQGQAARDYWAAVEAAWFDNHDGTPYADITPLPPLPGTTVHSSVSFTLPADVHDLVLTGAADIDVTGNSLANSITGDSGNNHLYGLAGNDVLIGGGGTDYLDGADGNDTLSGDAGNDVLVGGAGADVLKGGLGDDWMAGGAGDDVYFVDSMLDIVTEHAGEGIDKVNSSVTFTLGADLEKLVLCGSGGIDGTGNALANTMTGNSGNNQLHGLGGNDFLNGLGGSDSLYGGDGNDKLWGSAGNDVLNGGAGADVLRGGDGNDVITGGNGHDSLGGGLGADQFVFADGDLGSTLSSSDRIIDFNSADGDKISLSGIDSNTLSSGDQAFHFIGTEAFHNVAGELRYQEISGVTYVFGDTNGDGVADIVLGLTGSHGLTSGDFFL